MRHVISEPQAGSVVRMRPGDWLEVRLSHTQPGFEWQVVDQPGCLFPVSDQPSAERPAVLPAGPRFRALGFLAFAGGHGAAQRLRLALVHPQQSDTADVRDVEVFVA